MSTRATFSGVGTHGPPESVRRWTESSGAADAPVHAEVLELLMSVMGLLRRGMVATVGQHDLTPMQFFALRALDRPRPMGHLAELLHCDRSHITGVADELERRGAIERRPQEDDRRVKLLAVTPAGERLRDEVESELIATSPVFAGLPDEDQVALRDLLATIVAAQPRPATAEPAHEGRP